MMKGFVLGIIVLLFYTGCTTINNYAIVQESDKYGVVNSDGKVIVKPIYKHISNFDNNQKNSQSYAIVQDVNNKFGVINNKGEILLNISMIQLHILLITFQKYN